MELCSVEALSTLLVGGWLIEDAKQSASQLLAPGALEWLPNITEHFFGLRSEPA